LRFVAGCIDWLTSCPRTRSRARRPRLGRIGRCHLSVGEAAEYLACDKQRIYDLLSSHRLTKLKDGSRVLLLRTSPQLGDFQADFLDAKQELLAARKQIAAKAGVALPAINL
jgi:excisionase family DNA binding protein